MVKEQLKSEHPCRYSRRSWISKIEYSSKKKKSEIGIRPFVSFKTMPTNFHLRAYYKICTHIRREDSGHVRGGHPGQTPDAVHQRHDGGRVVGRQIERIDAYARVTEPHECHAHREAHRRQHFVAPHERSAHHAQTRADGSWEKKKKPFHVVPASADLFFFFF